MKLFLWYSLWYSFRSLITNQTLFLHHHHHRTHRVGYIRWIQCNDCLEWFHCNCMKIYDDPIVKEYHCKNCWTKKKTDYGYCVFKRITNQYRHNPCEAIRLGKNKDKVQNGTAKFIEDLKARSEAKDFAEPIQGVDIFILPNGKDLEKHFNENKFYAPIVVKNMEGLNMKIPKGFQAADLKTFLDPLLEIDVIDVHKQSVQLLTLQEFIELLEFSKIPYNSISLELSRTKLSSSIAPPEVVRNLSWTEEGYKHMDLKKHRPAVEK